MRGRLGVIVMFVSAALIAGGCKHMTPEQKRQKELDRQAAAHAKVEAKRAAADAKAAAAAQKKQQEIDRKNAEAQAKAAKKQAAEEQKRQMALAKEQQKQAEAQAKADKKAAEQQAVEAKKQAEIAAREQKKQAEMDRKQQMAMAKEQKKAKPAPAAVAMAPVAATEAPAPLEPVGPVVETTPAEAMTKLARQGDAYYPDDRLKVVGYPYILPENKQRLVDRHAQMQAASGQSYDATLSDRDFDGAELNATGRANLALALQYPHADNRLLVYINTSGGEDVVGGRAAAVERYWKASPWSSVALSTKPGPNPLASTNANAGLNALRRMERERREGGGTSGGGDTTGGRSRMSGDTGGAGGGGGGQ
jgi:hypothetical protein